LIRLEYKWLVGIAFVFGLFMDLLDQTIVNVALPSIQHEFGVKVDTIQWVVTGYLLSLAVFIPVSGYLADRYGSRRIYLLALLSFIGASTLCGLAQNEGQLIAFRMLQGVGGGMMVPVGTAMLFREFAPEERATASSMLAIPTVFAPMMGPLLGGILVDYLSWRWIFWVNIPVGLAGFFFSYHFLREHREADPGRFDRLGFVLAAGGFASLLYGLSIAARPSVGFASPQALGALGAGAVLVAALVYVELHHSHPMLEMRCFKDPNFSVGNIIAFIVFSGMMGALFLYPLFLQNPQLKGLSAFQSGLTTFPQALGVLAMRPFTSRMLHQLGAKALIVGGMLLFVLTSFVFTHLDISTSDWLIRGTLFVRGIGMALLLVTVQTMTFYTTPGAEMGRASSIFNVTRQLAGSFGVAIFATALSVTSAAYLASGTPPTEALVRGFQDSFWLATVLAFAGVILAVILPMGTHDPKSLLAKPHPNVVVH
jgi:EmrB/QacA subfamily drug resistance transporter